MPALFEPAGLVHDPGHRRGERAHDLPPNGCPHLSLFPRAVGDKLLELLGLDTQALGHRFDGLALAGQEQPLHVKAAAGPPLAAP